MSDDTKQPKTDLPEPADQPSEQAEDLAEWDRAFDTLHEAKAKSLEILSTNNLVPDELVEKPPPVPQTATATSPWDFDDVNGEPQALGSLLGVPPPLPAATNDDDGRLVPPTFEPRTYPDEFDDDGSDVMSSAPRPTLSPAPSDDEVFGGLPTEIPVVLEGSGRVPLQTTPDTPESTRISNPDEVLLAELARDETSPRRGPAVVRRDTLELQRRARDSGNDFAEPQRTRVATNDDLSSHLEASREEEAAAEEPAIEFALDDDFYDDIEIDEQAAFDADAQPQAAAARRTAHIVRRPDSINGDATRGSGPILERGTADILGGDESVEEWRHSATTSERQVVPAAEQHDDDLVSEEWSDQPTRAAAKGIAELADAERKRATGNEAPRETDPIAREPAASDEPHPKNALPDLGDEFLDAIDSWGMDDPADKTPIPSGDDDPRASSGLNESAAAVVPEESFAGIMAEDSDEAVAGDDAGASEDEHERAATEIDDAALKAHEHSSAGSAPPEPEPDRADTQLEDSSLHAAVEESAGSDSARVSVATEPERVDTALEEAATARVAPSTQGDPEESADSHVSGSHGSQRLLTETELLDNASAPADESQTPIADVAATLPPSKFDTPMVPLDLSVSSLPEQAGVELGDRSELLAQQLLAYEGELELLDETDLVARMRLEAGRLAERLGDSDRAKTHYEEAVQIDPHLGSALRALRRVDRSLNDWDSAIQHVEAELPLASQAEWLGLAAHRAELLMATGDYDLARVAVGEILDRYPDDFRAMLANLELAYVDGRDDEVELCLNRLGQAMEEGALAAAISEIRGRWFERSQSELSKSAYVEGAAGGPPSRAALHGLLRLHTATEEWSQAAEVVQRLVGEAGLAEREPQLSAALLWRMAGLTRKQPQIAGELCAKAVELSGDEPIVLDHARRLQATAELKGRACEQFAAVVRTPPERSVALFEAAVLLREAGLAEAAQRALERSVSIDPASAAAADLEVHYRNTDNSQELRKYYDRLIVRKDVAADYAVLELAGFADEAESARTVLDAAVDRAGGALQASPAVLSAAVESRAHDAEQYAARIGQAAESGAVVDLWRAARSRAVADNAQGQGSGLWRAVLDAAPGDIGGYWAVLWTGAADDNADAGAIVRALGPIAGVGAELARARALSTTDQQACLGVVSELFGQDPGDPRIGLTLMLLHARADDWSQVVTTLAERAGAVTEVESDALRYRAAVFALEVAHEAARAVELLTPVVSRRTKFSAAADLLEAAHRKTGDASALAADLDRVAKPSDPRADRDRFAAMVREAELFEHQLGDPAKAMALYGRALAERADSPIARDGYLRTAARAGEASVVAEHALGALKSAEERDDASARADAYEELARIDAELRADAASALLGWEAAVQADPTRQAALRELELAYVRDSRWEDLANLYQTQLESAGRSRSATVAALQCARLAERLGRLDEDVNGAYRAVFERDARNRPALFALESRARMDGPSLRLAELELAIADYFDGDDLARAAFLTRAAETYAEIGDLERAVELFRSANDLVPGYEPALFGWRRSAVKAQLWLDVSEAAQREAEVTDASDAQAALNHLAGVALMDGALNGERAVWVLRKVLAVEPEHTDAFVRLRMLYEEQGEHEQLAELLSRRLQGETNQHKRTDLLFALADLHRNFLDDRDAAKDNLHIVLREVPGHARAISLLSDIAWEQGDWPKAAEMLIARARIEKEPDALKQIFYRLGTIYADRLPDAQWALKSFQKVLTYDGNDLGALERISELAMETEDWNMSLGACERLVKASTDVTDKIRFLHRVGKIYREGLGDTARAERAYRAAIDLDPASPAALRELVGFFDRARDVTSVRVHLDQVAAAMRARIDDNPLDREAYSALARTLHARHRAGVSGSLAAARCSAEMALSLGSGDDFDCKLAAEAGASRPPIAGLGRADVDDLLFPETMPSALRQIFSQLGDRIAKHVGMDVRRYGVGRGQRLKRHADPVYDLVVEVARDLGVPNPDVYVSEKQPLALNSEPTSPISLIFGTRIASAEQPAALRFAVGRALKLALASLSVPAKLKPPEFGILTVALLRQFQPEFSAAGVSMQAVAAEQQRFRRLISRSVVEQLRPFAVVIAGADFDHKQLWAGVIEAGNRAGLAASGSVSSALAVLCAMADYADMRAALNDPIVLALVRYAVSEDYVRLAAQLEGSG